MSRIFSYLKCILDLVNRRAAPDKTAYKLIYCLRRREDIPKAEFYRYWLEDHGPLVRSLAEAIGACRYVQSHTTMEEANHQFMLVRGHAEPFDGITELWWRTAQDMQKGMMTPEGQAAQAALMKDESKFIDFSRSCLFMTEEHEIF